MPSLLFTLARSPTRGRGVYQHPVVLLAAALLVSPGVRAQIGTQALLEDLIDLDRLTRLSEPPYVTRQFSSYNRASQSPDDRDGWFANFDRGFFLRTEEHAGRVEHVMMDAPGPGAIVRIWSASNKGTFRFYLDNSDDPAIASPITELLGGTYPGIPEPLAGCRARGFNLYFPIAYRRHCKVTSDNPNVFYHINYRTYPDGTAIKSFTPNDLSRCAKQIAAIAERLKTPRTAVALPTPCLRLEIDRQIAAGGSVELAGADGPAVVCELVLRFAASQDVEAAARSCVLQIDCDGQRTVECPLGDFFGTAPGLAPYAALPMGVAEGPSPEMWSHWRMPFERSIRIALRNLGPEAVGLTGHAIVAAAQFDSRTCHFHAGWRIDRDIPSRPFSDWTHLSCEGSGRFVGSALSIMNPVRKWWGEGDEKIYVDGERFPSHFGTGSEDYYGYAWCSPERFVHAYHNQPRCDGPGNYGNTSVNRFHVIDDIPFTRSFRFDMENWHHNPITRTTRATVSYWYARPGGSDSFAAIGEREVAAVRVPVFEIPRIAGAIEGESLRVLTSGVDAKAVDADERFSGGRQLLWNDARVSHRLQVGFDAGSGGDRRVRVRLMLARKAPRVRCFMNDRAAGPAIDLSHERTTPTEAEIDLGRLQLTAGENRLTIEVVGAGAKSAPTSEAFVVGLDYLRLE